MHEQGVKETDDDKIIEVSVITDQGLTILVQECHDKYKQDSTGKTVCFVVHGQSNAATISGATVINNIAVESTLDQSSRTAYVYYNPVGDKVEISS